MAWRKVYYGTVGPFYYDDAVLIDDPDGDFAGINQYAVITDGGVRASRAPVHGHDVLRLEDLEELLEMITANSWVRADENEHFISVEFVTYHDIILCRNGNPVWRQDMSWVP